LDKISTEEEKAAMAMRETDSHKSLSMNALNESDAADGKNTLSEKAVEDVLEDQYPSGLKLAVLAGAAMVSVFMIALDQVSIPCP
jgi:hypothetical protein